MSPASAISRIDSIEDEMQDVVTYELGDGKRFCVEGRALRKYGLATLLKHTPYASALPTERLPVRQHGRIVGTMAPDFDPMLIKSKSFLYDPRPGDFKLDGDEWIAAKELGLGDLEAIPGFVRDREGQSA